MISEYLDFINAKKKHKWFYAIIGPIYLFYQSIHIFVKVLYLKFIIKYHPNKNKRLDSIDQLINIINLKSKPFLLKLLWNKCCDFQNEIITKLGAPGLISPEANRLKSISLHGDFENSQEFRKLLREEISSHYGNRSKYILQKIGFAIAFFTVSIFKIYSTSDSKIVLGTTPIDFTWLLCVLPIIAISYDVFIYAEDYKIRRISTFLRTCTKNVTQCEWHWELFQHTHDEPWSVRFNYLITLLTLLPAFKLKMISIVQNRQTVIYCILFLLLSLYIFLVFKRLRDKLEENQYILNCHDCDSNSCKISR